MKWLVDSFWNCGENGISTAHPIALQLFFSNYCGDNRKIFHKNQRAAILYFGLSVGLWKNVAMLKFALLLITYFHDTITKTSEAVSSKHSSCLLLH